MEKISAAMWKIDDDQLLTGMIELDDTNFPQVPQKDYARILG